MSSLLFTSARARPCVYAPDASMRGPFSCDKNDHSDSCPDEKRSVLDSVQAALAALRRPTDFSHIMVLTTMRTLCFPALIRIALRIS